MDPHRRDPDPDGRDGGDGRCGPGLGGHAERREFRKSHTESR